MMYDLVQKSSIWMKVVVGESEEKSKWNVARVFLFTDNDVRKMLIGSSAKASIDIR